MRLDPKCEGKLCNFMTGIKWSVYVLHSMNYSHSWRKIETLCTHTSPGTTRPFFVKRFSANNIHSEMRNPRYKIKATIKIQAGNDLIEEEYEKKFIMNSLPIKDRLNGGCYVTPNEGFAVQTVFNITCVGWWDEDEPLRYEFRYNTSAGLVINSPNAGTNMLSTNLPVGDKAKNFELPVDIYVQDSLGDLIISRINVKVGQ